MLSAAPITLSIAKTIKSLGAKSALTGKPTFKVLPGKVIVIIPYFSQDVLTDTQMNALAMAISSSVPVNGRVLYHKTVELRLIRLQYPYLDSSILAQYVAINSGKYNLLRMQKMMFNKVPSTARVGGMALPSRGPNLLPSQMTGVKLELAGRLTTQRSIPRKTVENGHIGSFTVNNTIKSSLDFSHYASKNKLNAFTIKV